MNGNGLEYPIQRGGYHPGDPPGPARAIYQKNPLAANGGHSTSRADIKVHYVFVDPFL